MCCELHEEWVDVLEEEEEEGEQVQEIKRCAHIVKNSNEGRQSLTPPSSLQNDPSAAERERPAATLPVSHASRYPRQRPGEPDDEFQLVGVHRSQHALGSRSSL